MDDWQSTIWEKRDSVRRMEELTPWQGNENDGPSRWLATLSSTPFRPEIECIFVYPKSTYLKFDQSLF